MEQQRINSVIRETHTVTEKEVECSYPKCGTKGHTAAQCWMRKKEQENTKLKRAGRSREPSRAPTRRRGPCYMCAAPESIVPLSVMTEQIRMTEKRGRTAQRGLLLKQLSLLKNRSPMSSIGIDSQDERSGIRRMKTQMKLMYSCLT